MPPKDLGRKTRVLANLRFWSEVRGQGKENEKTVAHYTTTLCVQNENNRLRAPYYSRLITSGIAELGGARDGDENIFERWADPTYRRF